MTHALPAPPLLVITDRGRTEDVVATATAAFRGGCRWLMLREKDLGTVALGALGARMLDAARPFAATVVINGDVDAALSAGAHGVHLPQGRPVDAARRGMGAAALIGVSAHSLAEAEAAAAAGADYLTLSPIFATDSKPGYGPALGPGGLKPIAEAVSIPVLALAGVSAANVGDCLAAGAAGVAVMGGVMGAGNPEQAVREIVAALG